jgi:hypothetical protein
LGEAGSVLGSCIVSPVDILMNNAYPCSKFPVSGVDGVRFKKKRRRRKKKGLLSRKNFIYDRGRNTWTLVGDYLLPPLKPPVVVPVRKKKKKKKNVVGNYSDARTSSVRWLTALS